VNALDRVVVRFVLGLVKHYHASLGPLSEHDIEVVLCLGRGIPGGTPTLAQSANVNAALAIAQSHNAFLFLSGGWTENGKKPGKQFEAQVMREMALKSGFPSGWIRTDFNAMDTQDSLEWFSRTRKGQGHAIIVADFSHVPRVRLLCKRMRIPILCVFPAYWNPSEGDLGMSFTMLMVRELAAAVAAFLPHRWVRRLRGL